MTGPKIKEFHGNCAFCLKPRHRVGFFVQGPTSACICNECVEIAAQIADEKIAALKKVEYVRSSGFKLACEK